MVTPIKIHRIESESLVRAPGWILLYGRRKVGKTFLARGVFPDQMYVLILRGGGALLENAPLNSTDDLLLVQNVISDGLRQGKTVLVDEFHRLPKDFLERMQLIHPNGKLILLGSSFHLSKELLGKGSPVLGLFSEIRLSLLNPIDILLSLSEHFGAESALSLSPYMRDPWTLRFASEDPVQTLRDVLEFSRGAIPALVGESFIEEDRFLSQIYEGVIRSLARGKTTLAEVSDTLHSMKLIERSDPSMIRQYVLNMEAMDLIERTPIYRGKGNRYSLRSKIMELHYYLEEKYGLEKDPPLPIADIIRDRIPHHIETFTGELLAKIFKGTYRHLESPDYDVDIIITRNNKPILVGEVKWGSKISTEDIEKFKDNTSSFHCRRIIITRYRLRNADIENFIPQDLVDMAIKARHEEG